LEGVMVYGAGKDKFLNLFRDDKIRGLLPEKLHARIEQINAQLSRKLNGLNVFQCKTEAKKIVIELLLGHERMSPFVEQFDADVLTL
jgi:hypothetical protein